MSTKKNQSLLDESRQLYTDRSLKKAIEITCKALELSEKKTDSEGMINANLLLGQLHNTTAKYQGDLSFLPTALDYLNRAYQLHQTSHEADQTMAILLALGDTYQNKKDYREAQAYFTQALQYAIRQKDIPGEIQAQYAQSQLAIVQNDFQEAWTLAETCWNKLESEGLEEESLRAGAYNLFTQIYRKRQDYTRLLEYCEPLLLLSRELKDLEKELNALKYLAIYYSVHADQKKAMQYLLEALEKSKSINYREVTAQCLINIGTIYAQILNYEEALLRYQAVLKDYGDVIGINDKAIVSNNIGNIYYTTHQYEKAQECFYKALEWAEQSQYQEMIALGKAQIGRTHTALGNLEEAWSLASQAQKIFDEKGDVNGRQINLLNLGNLNFLKGNYDKAIVLTSQGIVAAKRMNDDAQEMGGYQLQARIYRELKDFEKALQYQMIHSKLQEDFAQEQMKRQVMDLEIKYAIHEKQSQIEQLTKENKLQALLLEHKDQIVKQNTQLLQANEELRQFAYVASHDLKEPLRMIGSYTQLIFRRHGKGFDEDSKSYFDFVSEGVNRMNNLLDALLRYATIGKTDEEFESVRLNDAVELALINLRVRIVETDAEIIIPELPLVRSIQSLLIQLFQNLISNALKFKKPELKPIVKINAYEDKEEVVMSVEDNGIGIAPEYQERIFVIFQRLHSRARYEGTGIGLSICLKIVQRLGGRIWIESKVDEGAKFMIAIPKSPGHKN